jgi:hypothetical protein
MSKQRPCLQWMKTKEQRDVENIVITQIAKYPIFENTQKKKGE